MSLPWFYTIKVGSTFLTDDGLVTGTPYITTVRGIDVIRDAVVSQEIIAIDGEPWQQTAQPVKGVPLTIDFQRIDRAMYFTLDAIRLAARIAATTVTVQLFDNEDGPGDFYLTTYFNSIRFPGDFKNGRIENISLNFTVKTVGYFLTVSPGTLTLTGQSVTLTQG